MGVTTRHATLLTTLLIAMLALKVSAHTRALELTLDLDLLALGTHDSCGQLSCTANGNSFTMKSVSMTRLRTSGESTELLEVALGKTQTDVSLDDGVRGNGTLVDNRALIYLDLLEPDVCESSYFICGVTFTKESGETQRAFTTAGPGQLQKFGSDPRSGQLSQKPIDSCGTELQLLKDQIEKVEAKLESLNDRLDRRVALVFDAIHSVDASSRVSRLEDKISSVLLPPSSDTVRDTAQALAALTTQLKEMNESVTAVQEHQLQEEKPATCFRGMGDDVTKRYPPYAIMNMDTLDRQFLCDTQRNGGGWIVIQRRATGDVDFYRDWTSYREGFGSPDGDFWMGNEAIHQLTNSEAYELRVDIRFKGQELFAEYTHFRIEDEANKYKLQVGTYSGTAGDAMTYSNNQPFSTFEADHDAYGPNCAIEFHGAWWYKSCCVANLNGQLGVPANKGAVWMWAKAKDPVSFSEMKIRRV